MHQDTAMPAVLRTIAEQKNNASCRMITPMNRTPCPLPLRHGIAPSFLHLPAGPWPSLLAFLQQRFSHVAADTWQQRLAQGQIFNRQGQPFSPQAPFPAGECIWYYREVPRETPVPFDAPLLYRDERLLVVDKPHFRACIPGGRHVAETVLTRLRLSLGITDLTPIHRLDRETAGVMLFCTDRRWRAAYQTLFQQREVDKEYQAIARFRPELGLPLTRSSRLCEHPEHFRMIEVAGEENSQTTIELIERHGELARYRLRPATGKKHQLRAHMAALGIGIAGDRWYPQLLPPLANDDFSTPLQLLACSIRFTDPVDGTHRCYHSQRTLSWPEDYTR
jgi:tRNA pseudouridine32 synthase/23S rRNA pseudouridine746 synthase